MSEDDLYNLEYLSLVAKITQEIDNYTGFNDKTLAEFTVFLHEQSKNLAEFKQKVKEIDPSAFPDSVIENIDRLILSLHPKHKKSKNLSNDVQAGQDREDEEDKRKRLFPGLSLPDQEPTKDVFMKEVDDMMAQFEGAAKKRVQVEATIERTSDMERRGRSRSRSPARRHRSRSPDRGRMSHSRRDYGNGGRDRPPLDERPVLYKIYNGRISNVRDFGAFVQLEGIAGRVEGVCASPMAILDD